ncbi:hypothetical protein I4I80_02720 [Pseudomonas syringae pv. tomato]|nr:hypothetical protein [Pseudomonas syringae pv. tomato]MBW8023655.1 hypothetical protein [Pseudomonas syringae pv. tomato]
MKTDIRIAAVKMIGLALDEVKAFDGLLPPADPEVSSAAPQTFLDLVKQYSGDRLPEHELVVAIDAIAPLFPFYQFAWR